MELLYKIIRLFRQRNKGFSVTQVRQEIKRDEKLGKAHYTVDGGELEIKLGAAPQRVNPGGQWLEVEGEIQRNTYFDTFNCTNYNTENPIQIYLKQIFGISEEYTERYAGVLSNIQIGFGGSPHTAAEVVRKYGLLPYKFLPFDDTIKTPQQYYSPKPMTTNLIKEGQKWLTRFEFGHDWNWTFTPERIMELLEYSPLGVGVYAWQFDSAKGVYVKPSWATDNHWTVIIGYVKGKHWVVYDSYKENGTFIKHLDWNYPFAFMKRYYLQKKNSENNSAGASLYERLKGKHILVVPGGEVYQVAEDNQLIYAGWYTNSTWMQSKLDLGLRDAEKKKEFIGISSADFANLKEAVVLAGGKVVVDEQFKGLIDKLTK
jgi:hypothetical protein